MDFRETHFVTIKNGYFFVKTKLDFAGTISFIRNDIEMQKNTIRKMTIINSRFPTQVSNLEIEGANFKYLMGTVPEALSTCQALKSFFEKTCTSPNFLYLQTPAQIK